MRRIGLWQDLRRPDFKHAIVAAIEHIGFPTHLGEPGCGHVGADAEMVGENYSRAAHRRGHVDLLHQLPAGIMTETRDVTGGVFLRVPHVEAIERAVGRRRKRVHLAGTDTPHAGTVGDVPCIGLRSVGRADCAAPAGAMFEILFCQSPADGTVAQRHHLVADPGIDQRLGADDRAGAAGAIDDDGGVGIGRRHTGAQHQFAAGHADRARDVHGGIFVEPANVENPDVGVARDQS